MRDTRFGRRLFVGGTAAWLLGCHRSESSPSHPPSAAPAAAAPSHSHAAPRPIAPAAEVGYRCGATVEQIVGPYYLPDAPLRSDLREEGMPGIALEVAGAVRSTECEPLAGALVEVWQADHTGKYDVRGPTLRGRLEAAGGAYRLSTIFPGRYLNGAQYRPAHIHFRVTAPGFAPLITQLYFEGDPYNEVDPFLHPSLIRAVSDDRALKRVQFDVVLARA